MTVVHHLDDATLVRFASGNLDEAFSVAIAAHLELCGRCRAALRAAESCGGQFLELTETADIAKDAFDRLRDHIESSEINLSQIKQPDVRHAHQTNPQETLVPKPLQRYVGSSLDDIEWSTVAPGVLKREIALSTKTTNKLYMLHIAAGKQMPDHGHCGSELTLVLSGAYNDRHGRFARGDIADLDEHDEHQPRVDGDQPCICLIAAEGHTKPKGLIARLLRPLVGI